MTPQLLTLTQEARGALERYLRRVKAVLRPHSSIDADEVERDVRGHIEAELAGSPAPVTADHLRGVLDRLGSPSQWSPTDDLPIGRSLLVRLRAGPEDWRLAYITFALCVTGAFIGPLGLLLFAASIPTARATLALLEEEGEPVGARRWLLYPPLVLAYVGIVLVIFIVLPGVMATAWDPQVRGEAGPWFPEPFWLSLLLLVALAAGLWWTMLGLVLTRFQEVVCSAFWPFADWFERRHGMRITQIGVAVASIAGAALAAVIWSG